MRDHNGQALAYDYFEDEPGRRSAAKLLSCRLACRAGKRFQLGPQVSGLSVTQLDVVKQMSIGPQFLVAKITSASRPESPSKSIFSITGNYIQWPSCSPKTRRGGSRRISPSCRCLSASRPDRGYLRHCGRDMVRQPPSGKAVANESKYPYIVELVVAGDKLDVELSRRMMDFHRSRKIQTENR